MGRISKKEKPRKQMSWKTSAGSKLKELRFVFCQVSDRSLGARNFVAQNYLEVKKASPNFPFIVRECEGADALVIARYRFGVEKKEYVSGMTEGEIETIVTDLVNRSDQINSSIAE